MGNYITENDVKGKAVDIPLERAEWESADIEKSIAEAESYIEARLIKIGYTREQLITAPLIKSLCVNYSRYCVIRDIYTQSSPSKGESQRYDKWKDNVNDILTAIDKNELQITDMDGQIINPVGGDRRYKAEITTQDTKRIFTLADDSNWEIDEATYTDKKVVGEK